MDISPKALAAANENLVGLANLELIPADITEFRRNTSFDVAYSVLTFMHIQDKPKAL